MNLKNKKYLDKRDDMTPMQKKVFSIILEQGITDNTKIGKKMYDEEDSDDERNNNNGKRQKCDLYEYFLGKSKTPGGTRDLEFIGYMMENDYNLVHPRLRKKYKEHHGGSTSESENTGIDSEQNSPNCRPLKVKTPQGNKVGFVDYLDEKCWNGNGGIRKIKGPRGSGKTAAKEELAKRFKERNVTKIIQIDFKDCQSKTILKNSGSFMNWFMNIIYEHIDPENKIVNKNYRKKRINEDPCDGSYRCMQTILDYIDFDSDDDFFAIIIDDIDILSNNVDVINTFFRYLRRVFQSLGRIQHIFFYSAEYYLEFDDLESPNNVGELLILCEFDSEDVEQLLQENKVNLNLSKQDIDDMVEWMGGSPYLWGKIIPYLKHLKDSEFKLENFRIKAIDNTDVRGFFYRKCRNINKDEQLLNSTLELLKFGFLKEPEIRISHILEGLGVIKRDMKDCDKWIISCEIYKYFLERNLFKKLT